MMSQQHVRRLDLQALGRVDQRRDGAAGVDEEARTALAVGEKIRVRQKLLVKRSLNDHRQILPCCERRRRPQAPRLAAPACWHAVKTGAKALLVQAKSNRTNDRLKYTRAYRIRFSVFSTSRATIGSFVP